MTTYARQSRSGVIGALCATVTVLAMIAAVALFGKTTTTAGVPVADPAYRPPVEEPVEPVPEPAPENPFPSSEPALETPLPVTPGPAPGDTALAELNAQLAADRPAVEALVGWWVPQLSAKRPGLKAKGITYDHVEILRDFREIQARHPDALLLFSGEYSSFKYGDFWITVVPSPYGTGAAANTWCDGRHIPADDCYAKMISHTVGYDGATVLRGS
jgi:hypothetical protein